MSYAITVEGLGKEYRIGVRHPQSGLLVEQLASALRHPIRTLLRAVKPRANDLFWALKNVSFNLERGEVLGIIGRNGAGKSTLLKILSRITDPSIGSATVQGRLASLLEVGTGFHPELTGRENIYLNGTILGMQRREIDRRFDEIVAFSEVERFLETPVKHYSSGMYVRLAFAVAAHLDPDILVVDEVLAVGDRQFQEKCLGRMQSIAGRDGRTVVFVSHNLDAIRKVCTQGLYLREGRVAFMGTIDQAVDAYLGGGSESVGVEDLAATKERWGSGKARITGFELRDLQGTPVAALSSGGSYDLAVSYAIGPTLDGLSGIVASIALADARGVTVFLVSSQFSGQYLDLSIGLGRISCRIADFNLAAGTYSLTIFLGSRAGETHDCLNDVRRIVVVGGDFFGTGHPGLPEHCRVLSRSTWSVL